MFENLNELIQLMNNGLSNEEIISQKLKYLKSDEYKNNRKSELREKEEIGIIGKIMEQDVSLGDDNIVIFKDGFIDDNFIIAHQSGTIDWSDGYVMDDDSIYYEILNYIRDNKEKIATKDGVSAKQICGIIRHYFNLSEDSPYYNSCVYLKQWYENNDTLILRQNTSDLFVRYTLPEIINSYNASDFNGNIDEYTKLYIDHYYKYSYEVKNDDNDPYRKIKFDESKLFSPTKISDIKHTGAVACTEYSMVLQNCMAFLGYDIYMIGGSVNGGGHNYNVLKDKNGKYRVIDIAQLVYGAGFENIDDPIELISFGERKVKNARGKEMIYTSEFTEDFLKQKNTELTLLEAKAKSISEKEELLCKQNLKNGSEIGD